MNNKPILVILAAGMGSRYGGLKQIDPIGDNGEIIIDFSVFDAIEAGFERIVFLIKREIYEDVKSIIGDKIPSNISVSYAFQDLDNIPAPFTVPKDRVKPWGTAHAVLCCEQYIDAPFAVINADDYYGKDGFKKIYEFLSTVEDTSTYNYAVIAYHLENTVTDNGHVARGICEVSNGYLTEITERTQIEKHGDKIEYSEDNGESFVTLPLPCIVSMNFWGFTQSYVKELKERFPVFLEEILKTNPLKGEFFVPKEVDVLIKKGKATVKVMESTDRWHGVTHKEDKPQVVAAIRELKASGAYPDKLWQAK